VGAIGFLAETELFEFDFVDFLSPSRRIIGTCFDKAIIVSFQMLYVSTFSVTEVVCCALWKAF
jgi:hypothetical protein